MPAPMTHQDALATHLEKIVPDARLIGVDFNGTNGGNIELVKQALGAERIRDVTPMMHALLAVKDAAALGVIRLSCDVIANQFNASVAPSRRAFPNGKSRSLLLSPVPGELPNYGTATRSSHHWRWASI